MWSLLHRLQSLSRDFSLAPNSDWVDLAPQANFFLVVKFRPDETWNLFMTTWTAAKHASHQAIAAPSSYILSFLSCVCVLIHDHLDGNRACQSAGYRGSWLVYTQRSLFLEFAFWLMITCTADKHESQKAIAVPASCTLNIFSSVPSLITSLNSYT